jgi:serine protease AprX
MGFLARSVIACVLFSAAGAASAQPKHWVFFSDKGVPAAEMPRALAELAAGYDAHAVARRTLRRTEPGLFDSRDLPLAGHMVAGVEATGASVHQHSRWLNAVSVRASPKQLDAIARLPFVAHTAPVAWSERTGLVGPITPAAAGGYAGRIDYGNAGPQVTQMNLHTLHAQGLAGQGVRIAVLDTGFRRDHAVFSTPPHTLTVIAERDFINNDNSTAEEPGDPEGQHHHGTLILGTLAAHLPGQLVGAAYRASYILCKTEDISSETPVEEDNYVAALEFAELHGADVVTSSLSYSDWYTQAQMNGVTATTSLAVNIATANGVHCCTAAGNAGHDEDPLTSRLGAPADALAVITCGSVNSQGLLSTFSSDGPSADGRMKPELLARGRNTHTISPNDTTSLVTASGTSLSTPLVAGAVACLAQARPGWTPQRMREALFTTASRAANPDPLFCEGYGVLDAGAAAAVVFCGTADFDGDGDLGTDGDIEAFFACLGGNCCGACFAGGADFNADGDVGTDADIEAFFRVLAGGGC